LLWFGLVDGIPFACGWHRGGLGPGDADEPPCHSSLLTTTPNPPTMSTHHHHHSRRWVGILAKDFTLKLPVTPYRYFPASDVQPDQARHLHGVDAVVRDTASFAVLLDSLAKRHGVRVRVQFFAEAEYIIVGGDSVGGWGWGGVGWGGVEWRECQVVVIDLSRMCMCVYVCAWEGMGGWDAPHKKSDFYTHARSFTLPIQSPPIPQCRNLAIDNPQYTHTHTHTHTHAHMHTHRSSCAGGRCARRTPWSAAPRWSST
jgi:hypothetical protein